MSVQLYDFLAILNSQTEGAGTEKILESIKNSITASGGEIVKTEVLGKRKLAYPVKKQKFGIYVNLNFNLPPAALLKLERDWRLKDEIVRFLSVKIRAKSAKELEEEARIQEKIQARQARTEAQEKFEKTSAVAPKPEKPLSLEDIDKKIEEILEEDIAK
ncbi:30S ribosomal protein S6 [Candidatus Parcubacteria bacterium]|jgi:small subunit ribosomal protein S6|nr:MAG: 30S ribosomal protein S6 [Candidatus Parcubacteria bacterium]